MLQSIISVLSKQHIVLASASPRRKEILQNIGLEFQVVPSTFSENLDKKQFENPWDYVLETAKLKTLEVADKLQSVEPPPDLIIGADTVVTMEGKIYEKPVDEKDAFDMLSSFSGRDHTVYTGVVLLVPSNSPYWNIQESTPDGKFNIFTFYQATDVTMTEMSSDIIKDYIQTREPMDKAGGYGIQALGGTLVEGIRGDYFNVMGFPLHQFCKHLRLLHKSSP